MIKIKASILLIALVATALVGSPRTPQTSYCASQPPPAGLVQRCRSRLMVVPNDIWAFRAALTDWMNTCVSNGRARDLVFSARSVEDVFNRMRDRPAEVTAVRITPKYEPLKFEQNGRTCYGVKSVEFSLPSGTVIDDGPTDVTPVPASATITSDMIKQSAAAGRRALGRSTITPELSRFLGVLDGLERYGSDFDDRFYPVAPFQDNGSWNPPACFNYYTPAGRYDCLPAAKALKACQRNLAVEIVTHHLFDKVSESRLAEILEITASDIQRGVDYMMLAQHAESGALYCPGLRDAIKPTVGQLARKGRTTVYGYY